MRLICITGEPSTGKTTLMKAFMKTLLKGVYSKMGLVYYHSYEQEGLIVLGDYSKQNKFAGTDRLSMAVQPQAIEFLRSLAGMKKNWTIVFEGDRLSNVSFLTACKEFADVTVWALAVSDNTKAARHKERADTQNETWLKGRAKKVSNVSKEFKAVSKTHETEKDTKKLVKELVEWLA